MITPIYITSPKTKSKVKIGEINEIERYATFYITETRNFNAAEACGIDENVFKRKSIAWCRYFNFKFWDNRRFSIYRDDFIEKSWIYPRNEETFKGEFEPKFMIQVKVLENLQERFRKRYAEEQERAYLY